MNNSYFIRLLRNVMSNTQTNKQQLYSSLNIPKEQIDNLLIGMDDASVSVLFKVIRFMKYRMVLRPTSRQCYKAESYNDLIRLFQEHCSQNGSFQNLTLQQFFDIAFGWRIALEEYKPTPVVISRLTKRKSKPQPKPFIQSQPQRPVTVNASKSPSVYDDGTWYCVFCGKPVRGKYEKRQIHINEHGVRLVDERKTINIFFTSQAPAKVRKSSPEKLHPKTTLGKLEAKLEGKRGRRFDEEFRCTLCGEPAKHGIRYSTPDGIVKLCYTCRGKFKSINLTKIVYNAVESSRKKY